MPFRPDWEAVLTPVVDAMVERPDVDAARMAVIGISQAGFWVPRALAFEHRFAAAVADPGVIDVSAPWLEPLPDVMRNELTAGNRSAFDRSMRLGLLSRDSASTLKFRGEPYGVGRLGLRSLHGGDEVPARCGGADIVTPILITDPENEQFWPGQSEQLFNLLQGPRELVRFTADEGADGHCEPLGKALRDARHLRLAGSASWV